MIDHLILKLLELALKGLGSLAENFPDDPRLGRKLLFAGGLLVSTICCAYFFAGVGRPHPNLEISLCYRRRNLLDTGRFCLFPAVGLETPG